MKRRFLLPIIASLTLGCPTAHYAQLLNRSSGTVFSPPSWEADWAKAIAPGKTVEIHWYQPCVTIVDGDQTYYFQSFPFPESASRQGLTGVYLNAEYADGTLVLIDDRGARHELRRLRSCKAPL